MKRSLFIIISLALTHAFGQQAWEKKHFVLYPMDYKMEDFAKSTRGKLAIQSAKKNSVDYKTGLSQIIRKDTQVLFLGHDHDKEAGVVGYEMLLNDIYESYPFDCMFFEIDKKDAGLFQLLVDKVASIPHDEGEAAEREIAKINGKSLVDFALTIGSYQFATTKALWSDPTILKVAKMIAFMLTKKNIRWVLVDDYSHVDHGTYSDIKRRNEVMANNIAYAVSYQVPTCSKSIALNGRRHLTGNVEVAPKGDGNNVVEISMPIQEILETKFQIHSTTIYLASGFEWEMSGLTRPKHLLPKTWLIHPAFDLPIEAEEINYHVRKVDYYGLFDDEDKSVVVNSKKDIYASPPKPITPDPDHRRPILKEEVSVDYVMQGNIRSFDGVLYVN